MALRYNWHRISHEFNRDPEIRSLREQYHDWMALVWIEMLSQADRHEGVIKGTYDEIALQLAYISNSKRPSTAVKCIRNALDFMEERQWITRQSESVLVVKYPEYHTNQIAKKQKRRRQQDKTIQDKTIHQEKTNKESVVGAGETSIAAYPERFIPVWEAYPIGKRVRMGDAERAWNKIQGWNHTVPILSGIARWLASPNWTADDGQYIPRIADFLLCKIYLDTPQPPMTEHIVDEIDDDLDIEDEMTDVAKVGEVGGACHGDV